MTQLLTPDEARKLLRMGRNQFYELIKCRKVAYVQRGRKYLIPSSEIDQLIQREIVPAKRAFFKSHRQSLSSPFSRAM